MCRPGPVGIIQRSTPSEYSDSSQSRGMAESPERQPAIATNLGSIRCGGCLMPITPRDWSDPFLHQAREDLVAAWSVADTSSASTLCMLLQMVFEKLAKAAYARSGNVVPRTHQAASHLFALLQRHPNGLRLLRASPQVRQFVAELEAANPSVAARQPQPWPQFE